LYSSPNTKLGQLIVDSKEITDYPNTWINDYNSETKYRQMTLNSGTTIKIYFDAMWKSEMTS